MKRIGRKIILSCAARPFVRSAIAERADLSAFREKPTPLIIAGVLAIGFSFVLGWPAITALGIVAIKLKQPWIAVIGGPMMYGISHLVFLLGMYLSGALYTWIFCRWLVRVTMEWALLWVSVDQQPDV